MANARRDAFVSFAGAYQAWVRHCDRCALCSATSCLALEPIYCEEGLPLYRAYVRARDESTKEEAT